MANLGFSVRLQLINQQFKAGIREATQGLERMRYRMLALASAFTGGGFALAGFIGKLKEVARETNRAGVMLENVTGKGYMYARTVGYLSNLSRRYKQDLNVLTESFAKMKAASDSAGISVDAQEKMFSSFTRTITAFNLSNADARLAQLALQQMMSKGKVSAEELRRQLGEKIPIAMAAMANAAGVPISQLDKLLKGGKLISHEVMPKFAEELEKMTKNVNLDNIESSLNEQKNKLIEFAEWLHVKDIYKGLIDATIKAMDYLKKSFISLAATLAGIFAGVKMGGFAKKASLGLRQARNEAMALHKEASRALKVAKKDVKASKTAPAAVVRAGSQVATSVSALHEVDAKILASRQAFAAKERALEQSRIAGRAAVLSAADAADLARAEKANAALLRATAARTRAQLQLERATAGASKVSGGSFLQRQAAADKVAVARGRVASSEGAYSRAFAAEQKALNTLGESRIAAARAYDAETKKMHAAMQAQQGKAEERLQSTRQANLARFDAARRASSAAHTAWDNKQEQAKHNVRMALQAKASARAMVLQAQAGASMPKFWASMQSRSVGFFGYLKGAVTFAGAHIRATGSVVLATLRAGLVKFGVMLRSVFSATLFAAVFGLIANIIGKIIEGVRETKRLKSAVDDFHAAVARAGDELGEEGERLQSLQRLLNDRNVSESMRLSIMNQMNGLLRTQFNSEEDLNAAVERRLALLRAESRLRAAQERRTEADKALLDIVASADKDVQPLIERIGVERLPEFHKKTLEAKINSREPLWIKERKRDRVRKEYGLNEGEAAALFDFTRSRGGFWNAIGLSPTHAERIQSHLAVRGASDVSQRNILNEELHPARKKETDFSLGEMKAEFARITTALSTGSITGAEAASRKLQAEASAVERVKGVNENSTAGVAWARNIEERLKAAAETKVEESTKTPKVSPTERVLKNYREEVLAVQNLQASPLYRGTSEREALAKRGNEAHGALLRELTELEGKRAPSYPEYKRAAALYKPVEGEEREYHKALEEYTAALGKQKTYLDTGLIDEEEYKRALADLLESYLRRAVVLDDLTDSERKQLEAGLSTHAENVSASRGEKPVLGALDTTFDYKKAPSELLADYHRSLAKYQSQLEKWPNTSDEREKVKRDIEAIEAAMRRLEVEEDIDTYKKKITELHRTALSGVIGAVRTLAQGLKGLWDTLSNSNADALDRFFALFDLIVQMTSSVNQLAAAFGKLDKVKTLLTSAENSEGTLPSLSTTVGKASEGTGEVIKAAKDTAVGLGIGGGEDAEAIGERAAALGAETEAIASKGEAVAETTAMIGAETAAIGLNTAATTAGGAVDTVVKATETANAEVETAAQMKLAGAKAGAAYAGIPFAGIAMAIGAITAIMGAIKMAKGFANGGLVDYGTTFGDTTPAFVNKGERILSRGNQEWLQGLASRVRSDATGGGRVEVTGRFELENNKLVAAVNKENQRWKR